jgi:hypothetical protein
LAIKATLLPVEAVGVTSPFMSIYQSLTVPPSLAVIVVFVPAVTDDELDAKI